ncbi:MAG: hypothetical protein GYA50_03805 [Eubacteriaceae bacterium]|nr:hypothetical protein [Eubacteriaceae bacterium]
MYTIHNTLSPTQCRMGILIMENISNTPTDAFIKAKQDLEISIREKYAGTQRSELKTLRPMEAYINYYKKRGYTYHVLGQLESVIKGKQIPSVLPCVEAMFMAELKNMMLTAGHDLNKVDFPVNLETCKGDESFVTMSDKEVLTVAEDYMIKDNIDILSTILRGPDKRTAIDKNTSKVIYTVYILPDIDESIAIEHLRDIQMYVKLFSSDAMTSLMQIY